MPMKERWTESEIVAFPKGEHDYFDRKSGKILDKPDWNKTVSKALSAFANSGGGHLLIGVADDGSFDGVEPTRGRTSTREWLEQSLPNLLSYPLEAFRVHEVEASSPSAIPPGKVAIVVDVGDSILAPHQSLSNNNTYYYRAGGHSLAAPHFYLETLRNRLVSPVVEPELVDVQYADMGRTGNESAFIAMRLAFRLANTGRVAAYKWYLSVDYLTGVDDDLKQDITFSFAGRSSLPSSPVPAVRDSTILPGLCVLEHREFGVLLRPKIWDSGHICHEFQRHFPETLRIGYRAVTESSRGQLVETGVRDLPGFDDVLARALQRA